MFDGTSQTKYERKKTKTMMEYWFEVRLKSSSRPPVFALLHAHKLVSHAS